MTILIGILGILTATLVMAAIMGGANLIDKTVTDRREVRRELLADPKMPELPRDKRLRTARNQGRKDMFQAWLLFNIPTTGAPNSSEKKASYAALIPPPPGADLPTLRTHGRKLRRHQQDTRRHQQDPRRHQQDTRTNETFRAMRDVAARIYLLSGDTFASATGSHSPTYLAHDDPEVVTAYLRGGADALDGIRRDIITARDTERAYQQRREGVTEVSRGNDAALEALRDMGAPSKSEVEEWTEKFNEGA